MSITIQSPIPAVSHTPGVRVRQLRPITAAMRRLLIAGYNNEQFPTVREYARAISAALEHEGYRYSPGAIEALLSEHRRTRKDRRFLWERAAEYLSHLNPRTRTAWHDPGDLCVALGVRIQALRQLLMRLRKYGYSVQRRRASFESAAERGWRWEYRVWKDDMDTSRKELAQVQRAVRLAKTTT